MVAMTRRGAVVVATVLCVVMVAELAAGFWFDHLSRNADLPSGTGFSQALVLLIVGVVPSAVVGAAIAVTHPRHPVGWLFLALGASLLASGPIDGYAEYAHFAASRTPPGADLAALLADREWVAWLVIPGLILFLTPDGRFLTDRWRWAGRALVWSGVLLTLLAAVSTTPLEAPYEDVRSPFAIAGLTVVVDPLRFGCVLVLGAGLLASAASLVVRFRRSRGEERRQLLWLVIAAVPAPLFVGLAFGGSMTDHTLLTLLGTAGFVAVIPVAAGLAVLRYRLYDVDRVLTATAVYSLLTAALVATYAVVVWLGAELGTRWAAGPAISATAGAVAAAAVAAPLRRVIQTALDRRFNRRAYDARQVVRAGLAEEDAGIDLTGLLRRALGDGSVTVAYPADDAWVLPDGSPAPTSPASVSVTRHGRVVARVGFDPAVIDESTVARTAALAATELDNGRLRAEVARRLEEIDGSRRRLATAQRTERRRIERDLHDGAQQSLLALAFELQSAQVNGDPERMRSALVAGAASARDAVRELRELANGLHPAALVDGGLSAALDDMARHSPVPLRLEVVAERLDPGLEFTAWLVLGEAIVNAQKHAGAQGIDVGVARSNGHLLLRVADDGRGGASPDGPGLRGMRDRVETAQGELTVSSGASGTTIEAVLPCGS